MAPTQRTIGCYFIPTVTAKCIANIYSLRNRVLYRAFARLERYDGKLSCTVLRGLRRSNTPWLPDFIGNVRRECLDHILILSEKHLRRVMTAYVAYYTDERP